MLKNWKSRNKYYRAFKEAQKSRRLITLDFPYSLAPRWKPERPNIFLEGIIQKNKKAYVQNMREIAQLDELMPEIQSKIDIHNGYMPLFDGMTIIWAMSKTKSKFIEVGSGYSTMFADIGKRCLNPDAKIISIDPQPRSEIDAFCDEIIRAPVEDVDLSIFDELEAGDTIFIDNSHRAFMNSDVTVVMLEIIPRLKPGVLVGIHDIFLPFDYPSAWQARIYNEQYLLACFLLANPEFFDIQLANHWISENNLHLEAMTRFENKLHGIKPKSRNGHAFWGVI